MSMCYWMIEGIGVRADRIESHVNKEKLLDFLIEQLPDDGELRLLKSSGNISSLDPSDYYYGEPFENFADMLCHCDDTDSLIFGGDGDGNDYFYYPPSMPWHHTKNEPDSLLEVHNRIVDAVQKLTDMTREEILEVIQDDLYEVGFG